VSRSGGNFSTHDELADLTKLNHQLETIYDAFNGNINFDNIDSEGIRNANFDAREAFAQESWNNAVKGGHFPTWSNGSTSIPDGWTAEGTPSYLRHCPSTQAPSQLDGSPIFYAVSLTATGADNEGIKQTFNVFSSMTYTVSLKVKCNSGSVARVTISDDGSMDTLTYNYTDTTWQSENDKKYFTFTTAADSEQITITLTAKNDGDTVMFSEVQVTEGRLLKGYQYQDTDADTVDGIHASSTAEADKLLALNSEARFDIGAIGTGLMYQSDGEFTYSPIDSANYEMPLKGSASKIYAVPGDIVIAFRAKCEADGQGSTVTIHIGTDTFATTAAEVNLAAYAWYYLSGTITVSGWQTVKVYTANGHAQDTWVDGIMISRD